jgi:antirestriction protein ArdC
MRNEERQMINFSTGYEYSGKNAAALIQLGYDENDAFVTFKQAIKLDGISGKNLKGIKKAATLVRYSKTEKEQDENGKMVAKPIYFSVFDVKEVLKRKVA